MTVNDCWAREDFLTGATDVEPTAFWEFVEQWRKKRGLT